MEFFSSTFEGSSWKNAHWGKKQLFPEWTFFLTFGTIDDYTKWMLLEKHFDKMTRSRSSICNFFSEEIPLTLGSWKKQIIVQNKTKVSEEKNPSWNIRNSFLFWTTLVQSAVKIALGIYNFQNTLEKQIFNIFAWGENLKCTRKFSARRNFFACSF